MKRFIAYAAALAACSALLVSSAAGAYIVGAHSSEKGFATFSFGGDTTSASTSIASAAVGLVGTHSIFGGNGANLPDTYVFSYTPGVDADNAPLAAGALLGSTTGFPGQGNLTTGVSGGASGRYNVYFTCPETIGISGGPSTFTITQNGAPQIVVANLNSGGTGPDTDPGPAFVGGANNAWLKLGTVLLAAGNTYTVTQAASVNSFVSQRAHAVMWEFAGRVPEPASGVLLLAGLCVRGIVRRGGPYRSIARRGITRWPSSAVEGDVSLAD
ncbi:MAG: hypothetical protein IT424_08625 [Pirellulales bacterium]|nr:hypothetical protein [Pirellulales bacterium]